MKQFFVLFTAIFYLAGCSAGAPPSPLALEEIPAALQNAFKSAPPERQQIIDGICKQLERKQFAPVQFQLQGMLEDRTLSKDQGKVVTRALTAVTQIVKKQIEFQEASIAPLPSAGGARREPPPVLPPGIPADEEGASQAKMMREIYRRTK